MVRVLGLGSGRASTRANASCEVRTSQESPSTLALASRPLAAPGEVLVTGTVRDLVAGSRIEFTNRGDQVLKGVPRGRRILAVKA